ncbi:hypothetical protein L3Q82_016191, partial [Scortum barcoo]
SARLLSTANMAALNVIVDKLVSLRSTRGVRDYFHWTFLLISVVGSILKDFTDVPQTYFSSSRNVLNLYFVKLSWGWTLALLAPFVILSNFSPGRRAFFVRRLMSLVVATVIWYTCTQTFLYIEDWWGSCLETDGTGVLKSEFLSKSSCRQAGLHWQGFDISGHSFILAYSALFIMEETAPMASLKTVSLSALSRTLLNLLYVALNLLVFLWVWMFVCTSVYFHYLTDKVFGTICGLLGWYLTYQVWYQKPWSPGRPSPFHPKEQKQHA